MQQPDRDRNWHVLQFLAALKSRSTVASSGWWAALGLSGLVLGSTTALAAEPSPLEGLPQNTAMVVMLDTSEETWAELDRFRIVQLLTEQMGITPNPGGLPYLPYSINYQAHIQPWIGDQATAAILPSLGGLPASMADHTVMLAPIQDWSAFDNYFQMLTESQPTAPETETFRQTEILFWPGQPSRQPEATWPESEAVPQTWNLVPALSLPLQASATRNLSGGNQSFDIEIPLPIPQPTAGGLAIAVLPDTLVAAETPAAIKTFLRYRRGGQGQLVDSPQFQRTLAHPQQPESLVTVYGNTLEMLKFSPPEGPFWPGDWPLDLGPNLPPLETLRAINFGGTLEALVFPTDQGMQFQGRLYYDSMPFTFGLTPQVPQADSVLEHLPASTYLLMSGRNLAGLWRQVAQVADLLDSDLGFGLDDIRE